jgi:DNA repair exonuclease SbcCD ATPase subunit
MIYFKDIRWKNFLSTGNVWTKVKLNEHANTIIVGENGSGKSTILDALCFVLFNKPFRKISKSQMLNSINMGGLEVHVNFTIGKTDYIIKRGIKPALFEIYQDNTLLNQPGSSRDYQKQLEETIIKLNFKSFTQIVVLGASTFIPFMQLSVAHRREVIEDLLDISIFSNMGKLLKDRVADNRESIRDTDYQIDLLMNKIETQQSYIRKLKEQNDDTIATFQGLIDGAQDEINDLSQTSNTILLDIEKLSEKVLPLKGEETKRTKLDDIHKRMSTKVKNIQKKIQFFAETNNCPTCSQEIDETIKKQKIAEHEEQQKEIYDGEDKLVDEVAKLDKRIMELMEKQTELNSLQTQITENNSNIKSLNKSIKKNQDEIEKIKSTGVDSTDAIETLKTHEDDKRIYETKKEELVNEKELFGVAVNMLKDDGIKKKIIKQYVPVMNKLINKYLAALDFFVLFELDEQFNEVIRSRHRDEFSYASFSEGEKMRIDLALLFTWRAIAKLKNSINTNLLVLDEVFDASLDNNGCDEFLKLLNQLDNQTNVFVISHKGDILAEKFRNQIKFEKIKNFSRIAA